MFEGTVLVCAHIIHSPILLQNNLYLKISQHILYLQIENEYGPVEWEIGAPGKSYTKWFANMAVGLNTGVPWIMCKQEDTPDPIVRIIFNFSLFGSIYSLLPCSSADLVQLIRINRRSCLWKMVNVPVLTFIFFIPMTDRHLQWFLL